MSMGSGGQSARRTRLGAELAALRGQMSQSELSRRSGVTQSEISRLENGKANRLDLFKIEDLLDALGVVGARRERVIDLARLANEKGWWQSITGPGMERHRQSAEMIAGVTQIDQVSVAVLPGLLQTPAYMKALFVQHSGNVTAADADEAARVRQRRQDTLDDPGFRLDLLIHEAALTRIPCPVDDMAEQLRHLAALDRSNVSLRVLPRDRADEMLLLLHGFSIYRYTNSELVPLVAVETTTADLVLDDPDDISTYGVIHQRLATIALPPEASRRLIEQTADAVGRE